MQNLQYATSDSQENRSPPGDKCNKVGCVSSTSSTGLHFLSLGHTYSLLLNHLLSSFKRLNEMAKAGGKPPGQGLGWRAQFSVLAQGISVGTLWWLAKTTLPFPICEKSQVASFYLRMEVGKKFSGVGNVCETSGTELINNKRVRFRNLSVTTAADLQNKHLRIAVLVLYVQTLSRLV